jgi:hypothetical protein
LVGILCRRGGGVARARTPSCWKEYASRGVSLNRLTRSTPSLSACRLVTSRAASCICSEAVDVMHKDNEKDFGSGGAAGCCDQFCSQGVGGRQPRSLPPDRARPSSWGASGDDTCNPTRARHPPLSPLPPPSPVVALSVADWFSLPTAAQEGEVLAGGFFIFKSPPSPTKQSAHAARGTGFWSRPRHAWGGTHRWEWRRPRLACRRSCLAEARTFLLQKSKTCNSAFFPPQSHTAVAGCVTRPKEVTDDLGVLTRTLTPHLTHEVAVPPLTL